MFVVCVGKMSVGLLQYTRSPVSAWNRCVCVCVCACVCELESL